MIRLRRAVESMSSTEFESLCKHISGLSDKYNRDAAGVSDFEKSLKYVERAAKLKELTKAMEEVRNEAKRNTGNGISKPSFFNRNVGWSRSID